MEKFKFEIPTLNDGSSAFITIINLCNNILNETESISSDEYCVLFSFDKCKFLRQNAIAFLGGISTFLSEKGFKVFYDFQTMPKPIKITLENADLMNGHFGFKKSKDNLVKSKDFIPYKNFTGNLRKDENLSSEIANYVEKEWLRDDRILLKPKLKKDLTARMYELIANALEHSGSQLGCFTCGNVYTPQGETEIVLTILDLGVGIVQTVKNFFYDTNSPITNADAIRWAFTDGNTTRPDNSGGLGLNLVYEFLNITHGVMDVYCNNIFLRIEKKGFTTRSMNSNFSGTMINIRFRHKDNTISGYKEEL